MGIMKIRFKMVGAPVWKALGDSRAVSRLHQSSLYFPLVSMRKAFGGGQSSHGHQEEEAHWQEQAWVGTR